MLSKAKDLYKIYVNICQRYMTDPFSIYDAFEDICPEHVSTKTYKRNEYVLRTGDIEPYSYLVLEGAVRIVYATAESEQNIRFGYKNSLFASLPAYFDESKSEFDIVAIRKTTLKRFDKSSLFSFIDSRPEFQQIFSEILKALIGQQIERELDLLTHSPLERYNRVMERSPQLFQEIPAVYIANYLRMSPEHLSRLRNS